MSSSVSQPGSRERFLQPHLLEPSRWGSEYQGGESTFNGLKAANHTQWGAGGAV